MGEPFDWLETKRNPDVARAQKARREGTYRQEMEERAALLQRLGQPKEVARTRLSSNLRWDFEGREAPFKASDIDAIVERVYGSGPSGKPAARTKGGTR